MSKSQFRSGRLTRRDRAILDHVARFRMTTNEVVQRLYFDEQHPNAVTKVTARLVEQKLLAKFPLTYPQSYFRLGEHGVALFGLHESRMRPLGPQSLPTEYGVLCYATLREQPLQRLMADELQQRFPDFESPWCDAPHVLRAETQEVVELLRVDLGGSADHVARKVLQDVLARTESRTFREALQRRAFRCVVITTTTEKAAAIQTALQPHRWPEGLDIHLAAVPNLLPLIPGGDHAA